jgi:hypothetical protein
MTSILFSISVRFIYILNARSPFCGFGLCEALGLIKIRDLVSFTTGLKRIQLQYQTRMAAG